MKLTPKQEKFCQGIVKGLNQSDAYRAAFNAKRMKAKTIHENASRLMADRKIKARIDELMAPVVEKVQLTREQWILDGLKLYRADPRKLFDTMGNPIPLPELSDNEATLIEGFKFKEDYLGVKKSDGNEQAVASGYTQDYKLTGYKARHEYMGRAMGFLKDKEAVHDIADLIEELVKLSRTDAAR